MCKCVYVYTYMCIYAYIYVCVCIHIHIHSPNIVAIWGHLSISPAALGKCTLNDLQSIVWCSGPGNPAPHYTFKWLQFCQFWGENSQGGCFAKWDLTWEYQAEGELVRVAVEFSGVSAMSPSNPVSICPGLSHTQSCLPCPSNLSHRGNTASSWTIYWKSWELIIGFTAVKSNFVK